MWMSGADISVWTKEGLTDITIPGASTAHKEYPHLHSLLMLHMHKHATLSLKHVHYTLSLTKETTHAHWLALPPHSNADCLLRLYSSDWCPRGRRECGGVRWQLVPAAVLWQWRCAVQGVGQTDTAGGQTAACRTAGWPPRRHHLHPQQGGEEKRGMLLVFYQSVNEKLPKSSWVVEYDWWLVGSWLIKCHY